jgi:uncharacterized SAM-binding protein YcdF (DUF218 family)
MMARETSLEPSQVHRTAQSRAPVPSPGFWIAAILLVLLSVVIILGIENAASFLRVSDPDRADVIVVLAGGPDDSRYLRAVDLMKSGYAGRIALDAEEGGEKYGKSNAQLARDFLERIHAENTEVVPVYNDSTYGETEEVSRFLAPLKVSSVLIVTSDYHTRRALSIFEERLPQYHWSVAGAYAPFANGETERLFGDNWWRNRRWAKAILDEWEKLIWWELVDRWKPHLVIQN